MPQRLIRLMELKERHLGEFFLSGAVRKDLLAWDTETVEGVVIHIKKSLLRSMCWGSRFSLSLNDSDLCPHCIVALSCDECFWARVHGQCNKRGSLYSRIRAKQPMELNPNYVSRFYLQKSRYVRSQVFAGIPPEEVARCWS